MKRKTTWILATACLVMISGTLRAANEMHLAPAPWAAPAPAPATPTIDPVPDQPAAGGPVTVTIHSDTTWTATSDKPWAVVTAPGTGNKNGTVTVTLAANSGAERTATITVTTADAAVKQMVTIKQLASAVKNVTGVTLSKAKDTIVVGGTLTLNATITPSDATTKTVTWTSSGPAVTVPAGSTGLSVTVMGAAPGDATITVKTDDQNKTATCDVHVKAATKPTLKITAPTETILSQPAMTSNVNVTFTSNANWKVTSDKDWVTSTPATGNGNGNVKLTIATNTGAARTANVKFETTSGTNDTTVTITINQAATGPTLALGGDTAALNNMPFAGGDKVVQVKSNGPWTISTSADWIVFLDTQGKEQSIRPGGNDQNVTVRVKPNNTNAPRKATLTFKTTQTTGTNVTKTITVSQEASGFSYSIANLPDPVDAAGLEAPITLNSSMGYAISVRGADWMKVLDDTKAEKDSIGFTTGGKRVCTLRIKGNDGGIRAAELRVYSNGVLVEARKITQTGNNLTVQIVKQGNIPVGGGTKEVKVSSPSRWEMHIAGDWLTVDKKVPGTAINDTLITFRAKSKNTSLTARTATVTFNTKMGQGKQVITITQDGTFSMTYDKDQFEKVSENGAERTVAVKSEKPWKPSVVEIPATKSGHLRAKMTDVDTTLTWLSLTYERENGTRNDGMIKINVKPNTTKISREARIILKTTDGMTLDTITVKQFNVDGKMTPHAAVTPVTGLKLNKTSVTVNGEKNVQLSVTVIPENATNKNVTWASSDTSIATVDANGLVTIGKKKGKVTITVTAADGSGVKATCVVDVLSGSANATLADTKIYATAGRLYLTLSTPQEVHIYNVSGALVRTFIAPAGDRSVALPSGIYIVRVGSLTKKVAVE